MPPSQIQDRPKSKNFSILRELVVFLRPYKLNVFGAAVALVFTALISLSIGQVLRLIIDEGFVASNLAYLNQALVLMVGVAVLMAIGTFCRFYLVSWIGERVVADMRAKVFERVLHLHRGFFETTKTGEIMSRITTDTTLLQSVIGSSASLVLRNSLTFIGGMAMLLVTNVKLTLIVLVGVPLVVLPVIIFSRRVRKLSKESQDRVADIGGMAEESLNAIATVQSFAHEEAESRKFAHVVEHAFEAGKKRIRMRGVLTTAAIVLVFLAVGVVLWVGGHDVVNGVISPGELMAFMFYAMMVATSVMVVSEVYGELQRAAGATERLIELMHMKSDIIAPETPLAMPWPSLGEVSLNNVTFYYPSRPDQAALQDFSLQITPGETIAFVGPSGSGKTTVMQLLQRFYDPQQGHIEIDGVNIKEATPQEVRSRMALVPQDPVIFAANAWENIRYGRRDASDEDVRAAARAAAAEEFLDQLPDGFDTFLGEKGVRLSGGQKQRISIARALLHDPSILLLDEATSALDAHSEALVQKALERLMMGRTTLVIAHRLATVVDADRICVIEDGRILAVGTHQELMASNPLYNRLAKLQFENEEVA